MIGLIKNMLGMENTQLTEAVKQGAFLIDVRTPAEFAGGSASGAVNIPLDRIGSQLSKFKKKSKIVVFCKSGMRSMQAKNILEQNGIINVINGGTVNDIIKIQNAK